MQLVWLLSLFLPTLDLLLLFGLTHKSISSLLPLPFLVRPQPTTDLLSDARNLNLCGKLENENSGNLEKKGFLATKVIFSIFSFIHSKNTVTLVNFQSSSSHFQYIWYTHFLPPPLLCPSGTISRTREGRNLLLFFATLIWHRPKKEKEKDKFSSFFFLATYAKTRRGDALVQNVLFLFSAGCKLSEMSVWLAKRAKFTKTEYFSHLSMYRVGSRIRKPQKM